MLRLDYYLRETAAGIRRNGIVSFAAMSTAFIALFMVGLALLVVREFNLVITSYTGNVQVAVYLTDPVNPETVSSLTSKLQQLPAVATVSYENKAAACARFHELFKDNPVFLENVDCGVIPSSLRVNLADAKQFAEIPAALNCTDLTHCMPGIKNVSDYRDLLERLVFYSRVISIALIFIAIVSLVSSILLVGNSLRMGMFARRKEIGIMRLVGATNWRIRVPFLIEGLVETLVGASLAVVMLFFVKVLAIDRLRGHLPLPLIRNADVLTVAVLMIISAVFVAILAGTIGIRRFLDV
jgi:cell division transport system permease protein